MPERFMALSSAWAVLFIEYQKQMLTCYFFACMTHLATCIQWVTQFNFYICVVIDDSTE